MFATSYKFQADEEGRFKVLHLWFANQSRESKTNSIFCTLNKMENGENIISEILKYMGTPGHMNGGRITMSIWQWEPLFAQKQMFEYALKKTV